MTKKQYELLLASKPLNWTAFDEMLFELGLKAYKEQQKEKVKKKKIKKRIIKVGDV